MKSNTTMAASYSGVSWRPLMEINSETGKVKYRVIEDVPMDKAQILWSSPITEKKMTYDSREQEFLEHGFVLTSFWKTYFNFTNSIVGAGILALPYAIQVGGLSALILLVHTAWASKKSAQLLVQCFYEDGNFMKQQVRFNFKHIATDTFSSSGWILDIMFSITYLICSSIYLTLCAETMESIWPVFSKLGWLVVCAAVILILIVLFPNMDKLSLLNGLGILNVMICAIAVLIVSVRKIIRHPADLAAGFTSYKFFDWRGAFVAYNIFTFTMATVILPSLFCEMKEKSRFKELSRVVYITVATFKIAFAFVAFFAFQGDTADVVTLNIASVTVRMVVSISIVVDKLLTTPLILYPLRLQIEFLLPQPKVIVASRIVVAYLWRSMISTVLLALCIAAAISVPNFAILSSLAGSVFYTTLLYIMPVVFWLIITRDKSKLDIAKGLWIILISVVALLGGVYQNTLIILIGWRR